MVEALNGSVDNKASYLDYGYFGVLGADFDENGVASGEYRPKMSYRTLQVIASIFREKFSREEFPVFFASRGSARLLRNEDPVREVLRKCFRKPNGSCAVAYWIPKELLTTSYEGTITVETALVKYMLERNPDICETTGSVNPVVCECNDCGLNDIRGLHVTEAHVAAALADCKADFAEGAVGAGRGMRCHGLKGGIGSASRLVELDGKSYTIGALVLSNHATFDDLIVAGTPIHELLEARIPPHEDKGSIITVLATDIPLSERQLRRLCHRALVGLSRTGSACGNGSGEIVLAFTTANRMPHYSDKALLPMEMLHDDAINPLFRAVAECVEESVLSSLLHAETVTGYHGRTVQCLSDLLKK